MGMSKSIRNLRNSASSIASGAIASASLAAVLAGLLAPAISQGQQKPPPPNPNAPTLAMPYPMGMQRGATLEILLTGGNLANPTGFWASFPGKVAIPTEDKNGADNAKLKVRLEVPADAPLGVYAIRLANKQGVSNLRLFCVDDLPTIAEVDASRNKAAAQLVSVPCVVAGKADAEVSDWFKIAAKAGQRLSFDVLGRRIGSPIDPQISLYHGKTLRELAHDNDSPGSQSDARLSYLFKESGEYLIEIKDVLNRGGADYVYRLRIGELPLATATVPMAAKRGSKVQVQFAGPQVEGVAPVEVAVPADPAQTVVWVSPKGPSGHYGWPAPLSLSGMEEKVEQEPNHEPAKANRLPVPGGVTGRFQMSDDTDLYVFGAKKGQKLTVEAQTLELGSSTLVYMILKNAKTGAELAKSNPQAAPPADQKIDFTAPDDGDYLLEVQHLNFLGGPSEVYHITIEPARSEFEVALLADRADLAALSVAAFPFQVTRRGYAGPIDVSVVAPANLTGSTTVKAGQAAGTLLVRSKGDVPLGPVPVVIHAKATVNGQAVTVPVSTRAPISAALANLPYPPLHLHAHAAIGIKEKAPFALAVKTEAAEAAPGLAANVTITAMRGPGFAEDIVLNPPQGLPPNVPAPKLGTIAKDKTEFKFPLPMNAKTPLGDYVLIFSGKAKVGKNDVNGDPSPLLLTVTLPFELKVGPAPVNLKPGDKAKVKIMATRKAGYKGPIAVELRNLPAKVTAAKSAIPQDKTEVEVELAAAPDAAAAEAKNVDALGTATALNNLQSASPPIAVRVQKK
ncbi:MAG: hypothetical protein L0Y71_25885 [Gemmataceae bacterium]|nr:hypothetical protein [Gemmataceae bacterium]